MLYPTDVKGSGTEGFFNDTARNLFLGLALYLVETPELPRTIGEILRQSSGQGQPIKQHLQGLMQQRAALYEEVATVVVDTDGRKVGAVVDEIVRRLGTAGDA